MNETLRTGHTSPTKGHPRHASASLQRVLPSCFLSPSCSALRLAVPPRETPSEETSSAEQDSTIISKSANGKPAVAGRISFLERCCQADEEELLAVEREIREREEELRRGTLRKETTALGDPRADCLCAKNPRDAQEAAAGSHSFTVRWLLTRQRRLSLSEVE